MAKVAKKNLIRQAMDAAAREFITAMLAKHDGKLTATARALGISRQALWNAKRRLGLHAA